MRKHHIAHLLTAISLGIALVGSPALASAASPTSAPAAEATSPVTPRRHEQARPATYAQREAASPRTGDFKGNGVGIYIGGSTLAVVLVVILVVVLL
jgi:hypothetical protein